jgi:hypothetical protein
VGVGLWFFDIFLIKITGIVAAGPLMIGLLILHPGLLKYIAIECFAFLALYFALFFKCNKNPFAVIKSEIGHQSFYSRDGKTDIQVTSGLRLRLYEKLKQIKQIISGNPVIPLFAFAGMILALDHINEITQVFLILYAVGILLKLCVSFLPIWWYTIPLLPIMGLYSSFGVGEVASKGIYGIAILILFLGVWIYLNVYRVHRMSYDEVTQYAWKTHSEMGILQLDLQKISNDIENIVNHDSVLTYGFPSLSAMVGASYDINFLTAAFYMDGSNPNWRVELHRKMLSDPPTYIFDMVNQFDSQAVCDNLGLHYQKIRTWEGRYCDYDLHKYERRYPPSNKLLLQESCLAGPDETVKASLFKPDKKANLN